MSTFQRVCPRVQETLVKLLGGAEGKGEKASVREVG